LDLEALTVVTAATVQPVSSALGSLRKALLFELLRLLPRTAAVCGSGTPLTVAVITEPPPTAFSPAGHFAVAAVRSL
jgi:hypothetical protein